MTTKTMQQAAAHHFGIAWDELNPFEQAHWEAAWVAGRNDLVSKSARDHSHIDEMMARFDAEAEDRYQRAERFMRESGRASISALQRHFKIAYGNACRLMDQLVERGVVTPVDSEGRRSIIPQVKP